MASPQQLPDPNRPTGMGVNRRPAEIREIRPRELRTRGPGAAWVAWWWVWLMVILCAVWFAGWGWSGYGGWWWGNRGAAATHSYPVTPNGAAAGNAEAAGSAPGSGTAANMNLVTGPGAAVLMSTDKRMYIGRRFQVSGAVVTKKVSDHVLWIGQGGDSASMLVVLRGSGAKADVAEGDLVMVTGTVRKAPAAAAAQQGWKLSDNGQKRLQQQGAYVVATRVERIGSGGNG